MTRKEALEELIAQVEAGSEDAPDFSALVSRPIMQCKAGEAYRGSLDAAKSLHEALLPRFWWSRSGFVMTVTNDDTGWGNGIYGRARDDDNPARAWLLAILRALHSMEPDT